MDVLSQLAELDLLNQEDAELNMSRAPSAFESANQLFPIDYKPAAPYAGGSARMAPAMGVKPGMGDLRARDEYMMKNDPYSKAFEVSMGEKEEMPQPGMNPMLAQLLIGGAQQSAAPASVKPAVKKAAPLVEGPDTIIEAKPQEPSYMYGKGLEDSDLAAAKDEARKRQMGLGIFQALAQGLGAASGTQVNNPLYQNLMETSDREVKDIREGRAGIFEKQKVQELKDLTDPKNPALQKKRDGLIRAGVSADIVNALMPEGVTLKALQDSGANEILGIALKKDEQRLAAAEKEKDRRVELEKADIAQKAAGLKGASEAQKELAKRTVQGVGTFKTDKLMEEFLKNSVDVRTAQPSIDELIKMAEDPDQMKRLSPTLKAKAQTLQQLLIGQTRESILGPGTISDTERAVVQEIFKDPTKLLSYGPAAASALKTVRANMNNKLKNMAAAYVEPRQASAVGPSPLAFEDAEKEKRYQEMKARRNAKS